jgi:hypothetical protein
VSDKSVALVRVGTIPFMPARPSAATPFYDYLVAERGEPRVDPVPLDTYRELVKAEQVLAIASDIADYAQFLRPLAMSVCQVCGRSFAPRKDGLVRVHSWAGDRCAGSERVGLRTFVEGVR